MWAALSFHRWSPGSTTTDPRPADPARIATGTKVSSPADSATATELIRKATIVIPSRFPHLMPHQYGKRRAVGRGLQCRETDQEPK